MSPDALSLLIAIFDNIHIFVNHVKSSSKAAPSAATTTTIAKENSNTSNNWNSPKSPVKAKSAKTVPLIPTVLEDLTTTYFENLKFNTIIENLNNPEFKVGLSFYLFIT